MEPTVPVEEPEQADSPAPAEAPAPPEGLAPEEDPGPEAPEPGDEPAPAESEQMMAYPLETNGEVVTILTAMPGNVNQIYSDWNEHMCLPYMMEATGVDVDIISMSQETMTEQFQLMVVSGDWPNLCNASGSYTGGLAQAFADDFVIELSEDMLKEAAPDYYSTLMTYSEEIIRSTKVNNSWLAFYGLADGYLKNRGMVIRTDWLDEQGLEVPKTLDEFTNVLRTFKDAYDPQFTFWLEDDADMIYITAPFNTYTVGYKNNGTLPNYIQGDQVLCAWSTDEYRTFVEWFREQYAYGVFDQEFYSTFSNSPNDRYSYLINGKIGVLEDSCSSHDDWQQYATEGQTVEISSMPDLVDENGNDTWGDDEQVLGSTLSITATCDCPELCLNLMNFFYTPDGIMMANYGIPGVSYEIGEDGNVQFTDLIVHSTLNMSIGAKLGCYCMSNFFPYYQYATRMFPLYSQEIIDNIAILNDSSITAEHNFPSGCSLTSEESDSISGKITDITTYSQEALLKFMTGAIELNDESWNAYVDQLYGYGLQDCMDVYQNAYDEFRAGIR